jgi:hypothetical protein
VDFTVNEGWADISVTTLPDSGFAGTSDMVWVTGGTIYRDYLVLIDDHDATVTIDVATEDGGLLVAAPEICLQHANDSLEHCRWTNQPTYDDDGGFNYAFRLPAGEWTWIVEPSWGDAPTYLPVTGTVTVVDGEDVVIEATFPLRAEADLATLTVDVTTFDGATVPADTMICVSDALPTEAECLYWTGSSVTFTVATGPVSLAVWAPDGSNYSMFVESIPLVATGENRAVNAVLYLLDTPLTMNMTVSDALPDSGDTITYTLHAYGPALEFLIESSLPAGLTDIVVTCQGLFFSELPTSCYEFMAGELVVPGAAGNGQILDVIVTITGTITGAPGDVITNEACVTAFDWTGDEVACGAATLQIATTVVPSPSPTATATETATATPTGTPDGTSTPDATATAVPTDPAEDPAEGSDPAATTTPATEQAVTKLPSTGTDASSTSPFALYAILAAAVMLAGAGALRLRGAAGR